MLSRARGLFHYRSARNIACKNRARGKLIMKLMEQVRQTLRVKHYALATERSYCQWIVRYIHFHGIKHPSTMGGAEVEGFLTHLATADKVAASTQNQALNALVFLYRDVLRMELGDFDAVRARRLLAKALASAGVILRPGRYARTTVYPCGTPNKHHDPLPCTLQAS